MYFDLNRTKSPHRKNRHLIIGLASLVLVSSAVAIPVPSMGAKGKVVESPAAPEAGVELLESILHRIGNDIQVAALKKKANAPTAIAMATPAEADAIAPAQQQAFDQTIDPAYVIRPKQRAEKAQKRSSMDRIKIAAAPVPAEWGARKSMSNAGTVGNKYADQDMGASSTLENIGGGSRGAAAGAGGAGGGSGAGGATRGMSPQNAERLGTSLGRLSGILNKVNTLQQGGLPPVAWGKSVQSPGDNFYGGSSYGAPGAANIKEVVPTSGTRAVQISKPGNVYDYRQAAAESKKFEENRVASAPAAPSAASLAGAYADEESADTATLKLDKPLNYRNDQVMKEYSPEPLQEKAKDKSSVGTKSLFDAKNEAARARSQKQLIAQRPAQFAFMPPSLVAGIPQLKLGASNSEAAAFMANHGKFKSKSINGWTVWSQTNASTGKTDLQIFIRRGTVEGFRIFNPAFVPERLGVNLSGTLQNVKEKFGEPAFWMYEPSSGKERNIKNLVYPVNQISFQMARSGKDNEAVVQSLLMFKFL